MGRSALNKGLEDEALLWRERAVGYWHGSACFELYEESS